MTISLMTEGELETLFKEHLDMVYRYCRLFLGESEADDAVSEVFVVAWNKGGAIPSPARKSWLLSVARKLVANRLKARKNRLSLANRYITGTDQQGIDPAYMVAEIDEIRRGLMQLRTADREVLALVAIGIHSQEEMGRALGCSSKTAGVRLTRARARFSQTLESRSKPEVSSQSTLVAVKELS